MARPVFPGLLVGAAGFLCLLGGLVYVGLGGIAGIAGTSTGVIIILVGIWIPLFPERRVVFAYASFVLVAPALIFCIAGFIVGVFLLILGGVLTYLWEPPVGPRPPR